MITLIIISYIISFIFTAITIHEGWRDKDKDQFNSGLTFLLPSVLIGFIAGWIIVVMFIWYRIKDHFDEHFDN
jgi:prolipoprotein diacylglyceryltransferase